MGSDDPSAAGGTVSRLFGMGRQVEADAYASCSRPRLDKLSPAVAEGWRYICTAIRTSEAIDKNNVMCRRAGRVGWDHHGSLGSLVCAQVALAPATGAVFPRG
jgi:hypothetical protein